MEYFQEYGLFLGKALTILAAVVAVLIIVIGAIARPQRKGLHEGDLVFEKVNDEYEQLKNELQQTLLPEKDYKLWRKSVASKRKHQLKESQLNGQPKRMFYLQFDGDVQASNASALAQSIDACLLVAKPGDQFLCSLESPGGLVHGYGFAASQLARIRAAGFMLTVTIDKVAASGGYMMACIADRIIAAPFAIVGSIGVVAQIPNFNRLLKHNNIDIELHTAGEYKRTLTLFGENTDADREKFKEELEQTHQLFKQHVTQFRPSAEIDRAANGDHWYASQALDLGLVDALGTTAEQLFKAVDEFDVYQVAYEQKKPLLERLGISAQLAVTQFVERLKAL